MSSDVYQQKASDVITRLKSALKIETDAELCRLMNISTSNLANWKTRGYLNEKPIIAFCEANGIDLNWVFYGYSHKKQAAVSEPSAKYDRPQGIPLIPIEAIAGIGNQGDYSITFSSIQERYVIPLFEGKQVDFLTYVRGSSMYPKYSSGDVVACRFIRERLFLQWNKVYVIDTLSQGVMIKRLKKSSQKGYITFRSDNKEYDDFEVPEKDIRNLALVVGVIRLE